MNATQNFEYDHAIQAERFDNASATLMSPEDPQAIAWPEAFGTWYERVFPIAYVISYQILAQREEAQDAVHDAAESILRYKQSYANFPVFREQFVKFTKQRAWEILRRKKLHKKAFERLLRDFTIGEEPSASEYSQLTECVSQLSANNQKIYKLYYIDGMSQEEVAVRCGIHRNTIRRRMTEIREQLRVLYFGIQHTPQQDTCGN